MFSFGFPHGTFAVVLDTCVLFPATLRDTLLRAAEIGLYRVHWSDEILEELRSNLVSEINIAESDARDLVETLRAYFPEAAVQGYEALIPAMSNQLKDRHVLAAAVCAGAEIIVTDNIRDFPKEALDPFSVVAQTPDTFLSDVFDRYPDTMLQIVREQTADLRNPPQTLTDTLRKLSGHAPMFANLIKQRIQP